jgi:hypothetical protein
LKPGKNPEGEKNMTAILPEGTALRKGIHWISKAREEGKESLPVLIDQACIRFNLSPKDCDFIHRFFTEGDKLKSDEK